MPKQAVKNHPLGDPTVVKGNAGLQIRMLMCNNSDIMLNAGNDFITDPLIHLLQQSEAEEATDGRWVQGGHRGSGAGELRCLGFQQDQTEEVRTLFVVLKE